MRLPRLKLLGTLALLFAPLAWGADQAATDVDAIPHAAMRARLSEVNAEFEVMRITPSPLEGLYLVEFKRQGFLYATEDGGFLLLGDMYRVGSAGSVVNLTEDRRNEKRRELLEGVNEEDMIVFSPDGEVRAVVSVFTDVDCGYCRKLHQEVPRLNELGIEIRYLAFPRSGVATDSYVKMMTAWCSDDPRDAITRLKLGEQLAPRTCENPVADQYQLGRSAGVNGTPALVLETGEMLPGYLPADKLAERLGIVDAPGADG